MSSIEWRDATYRDRREFQRFKCTPEDLRMEVTAVGTRPVHDRMYEYTVQEHLRSLKVPLSKRWMVRVGIDDQGLAAVQQTQEVVRGLEYDLAFGAVSLRHRHKHKPVEQLGAVADAMLRDTFDAIISRCIDLEAYGDVRITALIDRDNFASKKMCTRTTILTPERDDPESDHLELWSGVLPVPDPTLFG